MLQLNLQAFILGLYVTQLLEVLAEVVVFYSQLVDFIIHAVDLNREVLFHGVKLVLVVLLLAFHLLVVLVAFLLELAVQNPQLGCKVLDPFLGDIVAALKLVKFALEQVLVA